LQPEYRGPKAPEKLQEGYIYIHLIFRNYTNLYILSLDPEYVSDDEGDTSQTRLSPCTFLRLASGSKKDLETVTRLVVEEGSPEIPSPPPSVASTEYSDTVIHMVEETTKDPSHAQARGNMHGPSEEGAGSSSSQKQRTSTSTTRTKRRC